MGTFKERTMTPTEGLMFIPYLFAATVVSALIGALAISVLCGNGNART